MTGSNRVQAIASHNGLEATRRAFELMQAGRDTAEAVVAGISLVEDDPDDLTVGYGGLPNEDGIVELDAAVMHGPSHTAGAVAALRNIRHASAVADLVRRRSDHVLLAGEGALQFARAHGFPEENLLTDKARRIWLYWKETRGPGDDWFPPPEEEVDPDVRAFFKLGKKPRTPEEHSEKVSETGPGLDSKDGSRRKKADAADGGGEPERPTGTIHCAGMNVAGEISCSTSTSGLAFKIPGRVGDSPMLGAGLYCDNAVGSCGSTGRGEAGMLNLASFAAVELMRSGASPEEAGMEVLRRVAAHTQSQRLLDRQGRPKFGLKFYLLARDGRRAGVSMWGPAEYAVTDEQGTRLEPCAALFSRK